MTNNKKYQKTLILIIIFIIIFYYLNFLESITDVKIDFKLLYHIYKIFNFLYLYFYDNINKQIRGSHYVNPV